MLCERCKIREANIQYTEVINGVRTEHNFCAQCAKEMDFGPYSAIFDGEFPLVKLLSGLLGGEIPVQKTGKHQQVVCPSCGTTYEEFVQNSCFGCAECYSVFDLLIHDNIKQLQGSDCHKGRMPKGHQNTRDLEDIGDQEIARAVAEDAFSRDVIQEELRALDRRLKEALKIEDYETAAICRDRIKELREGTKTDA